MAETLRAVRLGSRLDGLDERPVALTEAELSSAADYLEATKETTDHA